MMRLARRDLIATCLVAAAAVLYALWLFGTTLPFLDSVRGTGLVVLGLGFAASAVAVVPGFDGLMHGNKTYLAISSLLGLVALGAGVTMLWSAGSAALTTLICVMAVLWVVSTTHHTLLARAPAPGTRSGDLTAVR